MISRFDPFRERPAEAIPTHVRHAEYSPWAATGNCADCLEYVPMSKRTLWDEAGQILPVCLRCRRVRERNLADIHSSGG